MTLRRIAHMLLAAICGATANVTSSDIASIAQGSVPLIGCYSNGSVFNTGYDGAGGKLASGNDLNWQYARTTQYVPPNVTSDPDYRTDAVQPPPAGIAWNPAVVVQSLAGGWAASPYGDATWISNAADATHGHGIAEDFYYKLEFELDAAVDPTSVSANMEYFADDVVYDVLINGQRQLPWVNNARNADEPPGSQHPYNYAGYLATNPAIGLLQGLWRPGRNVLLDHVKSQGGFEG